MKNYQNIIDQFEQYLDGELDEAGKSEIESAIAKDKEFAKILEDHKLLLDGIKYSGRKNLKTKLEEWDTEISSPSDQENTRSKVRNISWYYVAASVALFAVSITVIFQYNFNSYQRIASRHYIQYNPPSSHTRGEKADENQANKILELYKTGQFADVIEMTNQLNKEDKSEEVEFLLACSFMATKSFDDAMNIFEDLSHTSNRYKLASMWYLALGHLYKDDPDQAIPLLNEIAAVKSSKYSLQASFLLEDLN